MLLSKPKTWSRKGNCPDCKRGTGSKHRADCKWAFILPPKKTSDEIIEAYEVREIKELIEEKMHQAKIETYLSAGEESIFRKGKFTALVEVLQAINDINKKQ